MDSKNKILSQLIQTNGPVSGEKLAKENQMTRAGIWKIIQLLKKEGFVIYGKSNEGYFLDLMSAPINEIALRHALGEEYEVEVFSKIDSTSTYARKVSYQHQNKFVIAAKEQTHGRGRRGNVFYSSIGGCYFTYGIPLHKNYDEIGIVTICVAVAVLKVLKKYHIDAEVKWVNDIFYKHKKCGGILTEAISNIESSLVDTILIGIGLNINQTNFDNEIASIASSISIEPYNPNKLIADIIHQIDKEREAPKQEVLKYYEGHLMLLHKEIEFEENQKLKKGIVLGIDSMGQLKVLVGNQIIMLRYGEVSLSSKKVINHELNSK